ncbi:SRB5 [Candida metapsilosis]|uniref:Mediator of RNA polymerase II transcription subunit 18 n=1 Tax=Candida metapsilosis TaxID=273372 RepID=A0A8H7ZCB2_9ASCO|nr:SRB5 [Candida metapsilosis]
MVQQLSLVSSIPHSNYLQTITSLQAITGILQPQPISTYSLITKPNHVFKPKFEPGKINQIEQYYMKCTTTWDDTDKLGKSGEILDIAKPIFNDDKDSPPILVKKLFSSSSNNNGDNERVWTLQISDIPIAGKNQTCSQQTIYESTLVHTHVGVESGGTDEELGDKMDVDVEVKQEKEEVKGNEDKVVKKEEGGLNNGDTEIKKEDGVDDTNMESDTITNNDIATTATTVKTEPQQETKTSITKKSKSDSFLILLNDLGYEVINQYWIKGVRFFYKDIIIEIYKIFIRDDDYVSASTSGSDAIKLKLLDESNTFQIKCFVNVPKTTDVDLINSGAKELSKLQEFVKNLFILEIPDRMFMDSRIQGLK